jgi:hypothetical protein
MAGPPTITESGVLYVMQHTTKKRALPLYSGGPGTSFTVPRLARMLRWLENFSQPKVLLTLFADSQLEKRGKFSGARETRKDESSVSVQHRPDVESG